MHLTSSPQPKVIQDSNPDFWFNLDSNADVCRIAPKMLWKTYLESVYLGLDHHQKLISSSDWSAQS